MVRVENSEISTSCSQSTRSASELHSVVLADIIRQFSNLQRTYLNFKTVPMTGFEPTYHKRQQILSLSCLPFHHLGIRRWELVDINDRSHNRLNRSPPIRYFLLAPRLYLTRTTRKQIRSTRLKPLPQRYSSAVTVLTLIKGGQYLVVIMTCLSHSCYAYMSCTTCKRQPCFYVGSNRRVITLFTYTRRPFPSGGSSSLHH